MRKSPFVGLSGEEKARLLGPEFTNIDVLNFEVADGVCFTEIVLDGTTFTLVGDPQEALRTFLGGRSNQTLQ